MKQKVTVVVVGPFPPPVHGSSKNLDLIANELALRCNLIRLDISPCSLFRDIRYYVTKTFKVINALFSILLVRCMNNPRLYLPADAGMGMYYTISIVSLARLLRYRIYIHHRSFSYIIKKNRVMSFLIRIAGVQTTHILLCEKMAQLFCEHYRTRNKHLIVSNAKHIDPLDHILTSHDEQLVLGHLSNLCLAKGLGDVIEILRRFKNNNAKILLVLAGPPENRNALKMVESAKNEFGKALDYRGFVARDDKVRFYSDIDVFLFPTRYVHEAQPNVLLEAMSYGVPTISYDLGCIKADLFGSGGKTIHMKDNFVEKSMPILDEWMRNRESLMVDSKKSLRHAQQLRKSSDHSFKKFIDTVVGE